MLNISIHSARVGGDLALRLLAHPCHRFQSTPPVWAETFNYLYRTGGTIFQSTPPVWAETSFTSFDFIII